MRTCDPRGGGRVERLLEDDLLDDRAIHEVLRVDSDRHRRAFLRRDLVRRRRRRDERRAERCVTEGRIEVHPLAVALQLDPCMA